VTPEIKAVFRMLEFVSLNDFVNQAVWYWHHQHETYLVSASVGRGRWAALETEPMRWQRSITAWPRNNKHHRHPHACAVRCRMKPRGISAWP
jgi:hypothetical protein